MKLNFRGKLHELVTKTNIADILDDEDLKAIGSHCKQAFEADKSSRAEWERRYADATKLALQVMEEKSYPWPNCSNVKFPLLTIAAINFHARAFPALVNGRQVVTYNVQGSDPDGALQEKATRVTKHQNYMMLEATDWEAHQDKLLIILPILGCSFKKIFNDTYDGLSKSRLILPMNFVVPYWAASIEDASRTTEMFDLLPNAFLSRKRSGIFSNVDYSPHYSVSADTDPLTAARDEAQGRTNVNFGDDDNPTSLCEQHTFLDLDGDGYKEPYIVSFIRQTGQVCRIVARFTSPDIQKNSKGEVVYIEPTIYYEKYGLIPSPDGGFYDLGFGMLLGPLNESVNSLINQLLDAGSMKTLGGGFLGRGVRIRRGDTAFVPGEWKPTESTGQALKDNILPLPVGEPSNVLLELLQFLVQYSERISSANEIQMGELPGQNVKAGVMQQANTNGLKIFAAIYKRIWRSQKSECQKYYRATSLSQSTKLGYRNSKGEWFGIQSSDYSLPIDGIAPQADPNVCSKEEGVQKARDTFAIAQSVPGHDMYAVTMRLYHALDIPNPEILFPDPKGENAIKSAPSPQEITAQAKAADVQRKATEQTHKHVIAVGKLMTEAQKTQAQILELQAKTTKLHAEAQGIPRDHALALLQTQMDARQNHLGHIMDMLKTLMEKDTVDGTPEPAAAAAA